MELVRLKYSHEAMIDQMIANPAIEVRELAIRFGVTEQWIYKVRASGMFKEKLAARTLELVDPILLATIEERFDAVVNRSWEVLQEKLNKPANDIPDDLALQAAALGAKVKGYGGFGVKQQAAPAARAPDWLERSAERIRSLNSQGVIDVESREISQPGQAGSV